MYLFKTYTNGNREIEIKKEMGRYFVSSNVFDGVKWQSGHRKAYQTLKAAEKAAKKHVDSISAGWTANPTWEVVDNLNPDMRNLPVRQCQIICKTNPEWGSWGIYEDHGDYYDIHGDSGGRTLSKDEAVRFWEIFN